MGHFTHETESPWPWYFKHSHWWKRRSRSKFASKYAWRTNGVFMWMRDGCKILHGLHHAIKWFMFHGRLDYFHKPLLGGRSWHSERSQPLIYSIFYHVQGPAWIEIHWNSIGLRARSHMTSHYTWGSVTTLHDFGGVLGRPLDTFFRALTISWSQLMLMCEVALSQSCLEF